MRILWFKRPLFLLISILAVAGSSTAANLAEINCSNPVECYDIGMELLLEGSCNESLFAFENATKLNQSYSDAWVGKARALSCLGSYEEAIKNCDVALAFDSGNALAYALKAESFLALNRSEDARGVINEAILQNISDSSLWTLCGRIFSRMAMWDDALNCFQRATDLDTTNADAWYLSANIHDNLGEAEDALESYNQSVRYNTSNPDAWYRRGTALAALKRYEEAVDSFSETIALGPTNEDALSQKCQMLIMLDRNAEALECFNNLTELFPENSSAWMGKGFALYKLGRCNESLEANDRAIELGINSTEALIRKGDALLCIGLKDRSQEAYTDALEIDRHNGPALERMAYVLYLNGNCAAASTYAQRAIEKSSNPPARYARAFFILGNALNSSHQHERALEQYSVALEKTLTDTPLDPKADRIEMIWAKEKAYCHMGEHEHQQNIELNRSDFQSALKCIDAVIESNESDDDAWLAKGMIYYKLWQYTKAEECFNKLLEDNLSNLAAAEMKAKVNAEKHPHIILTDFAHSGIDLNIDIWKFWDWRPSESCEIEFKNMADVDGAAVVSIWTVPTPHIKRTLLATFEVPVNGNDTNAVDNAVKIPFDAFVDFPSDPMSAINFIRDINPVELSCEYTVRGSA